MYEIYNTEGIILSCGNIGEANKFIVIFTEKFGLISATAQGARNLKSKLRFSLQKFSKSNISLVRGKDVWRIVNAEFKEDLFSEFKEKKEKLEVLLNVLFLTKKLLAGETENPELYKIINKAFSFLKINELSKEDLKAFESVLVIRILHNLGYFDEKKGVRGEKFYKRVILNSQWSFELLNKMKEFNKESIKEINNSLESTGLF